MASPWQVLPQRADETARSFPWLRGVLAGVVAFPLAWASLWLLSSATGGNQGPLLGQLAVVGLFLYGVHFVPIRQTNHLQVWLPGDEFDPLAGRATTLPKAIYYLLPVGIVAVVGAALGYRTRTTTTRGMHAVFCGVGMALGYAAVALVGALALTTSPGEGELLRPNWLWALAMGLQYPLVFGTVGAYVGQVARSRTHDE